MAAKVTLGLRGFGLTCAAKILGVDDEADFESLIRQRFRRQGQSSHGQVRKWSSTRSRAAYFMQVTGMPKYEPLSDFLSGLPKGQKQVTLGFKRVEELLAIPGISEKKWKAIRERVEVK